MKSAIANPAGGVSMHGLYSPLEMITQRKQLALERVIAVVAEKLLKTGGANLLVSEIAADARCSTSTIYEAFGSKDGLLHHVFRRMHEEEAVPTTVEPDPSVAFQQLVEFLIRRIAYFGKRRTAQIMRAFILQANRDNDDLRQWFEKRDPSLLAAAFVAAAMDAGMIERHDPRLTAHAIVAGISYEPMMTALLLDECVSIASLLRTVLTPHLTAAGLGALETVLATLGDEIDLGEGPELLIGGHRLHGDNVGLRD